MSGLRLGQGETAGRENANTTGREGQPPPSTAQHFGVTRKLLAPAWTPPPTSPPTPTREALRPSKHHAGSLIPKYLCEHHQPDQIGEDRDQQDESLPAVLLAEDGGVHVHKSCDEALHADKLQRTEIPPLSAHPDWLSIPAAPASAKFKPVPKGWWLFSWQEIALHLYLAVQSQQNNHQEEEARPERGEGQHDHSPRVGDECQARPCRKKGFQSRQQLGTADADPPEAATRPRHSLKP